jgi:hypothetical protein
MAAASRPQQNHILDALPQPERERLFFFLKPVTLPSGTVLHESGDVLRDTYFPTDYRVTSVYVQGQQVGGNRGCGEPWEGKPRRIAPSCKVPVRYQLAGERPRKSSSVSVRMPGLPRMNQDQPMGSDPKAHIANTVIGTAVFIGLLAPTNQPQRPPPTVG